MIFSPSYPNRYPHNIHCTYSIKVPVGYILHLRIFGYDFENSKGCSYDRLIVYGSNTPAITLCDKSTNERRIISTGNQLILKLETDNSGTGKGFFATFTTSAPNGKHYFSTSMLPWVPYPGYFDVKLQKILRCPLGCSSNPQTKRPNKLPSVPLLFSNIKTCNVISFNHTQHVKENS